MQAVEAPPHSLTGVVDYTTVTLSWKSPSADNTLKWHNDYSYNGMSGLQTDPEGPAVIYAANKFAPEDLVGKIGKKVTHIAYNEYRYIADVTIMIYENGKPVYSQPVEVTNWIKDEMRKVELTTPYVIPEGKEIMFVVKKIHGYNQDFAAICDKTTTPGKGNVYSYDGEKWYDNGAGDFLITAYIENDGDTTPSGYNIYVDGQKVNSDVCKDLTYVLKDQSEGSHIYVVSAIYDDQEVKSYELPLNTIDINNLIAPVVSLTGSVKDLDGKLSWSSPLLHSDELSWSGKEMGSSIGGTASSNTKVWIRQDFDADELYFGSFTNNKITAINSYVAELEKENIKAPITGVTAFIMKDDVIVYSEEMPASVISSINYNNWNKFTLSTPYLLEDGHKYSFGLYYLQKPSAHPVGVDNRLAVDVKANSFSTSSPSSDFNASKPSWRTLLSGDIPGNFMLSADVAADGEIRPQPEIVGYAVYRDGEKLGETSDNSYSDTVEELGKYTYTVVTLAKDGKTSLPKEKSLTYRLPSGYVSPTILDYSFNKENGEFEVSWSPNAYEMRHYSTPTYITGFDDEMEDLMWGAQFTAEDMADYAGYKMNSLTFGIGDSAVGDFELMVMADKTPLYTLPIEGKQIDAGYMYTLKLDDANIIIPEGKNIYLAYHATTVPAESTPILLDEGPAVTGGAMMSLTGGYNWNKLSTFNPALASYNIVIGAIISPVSESQASVGEEKMSVSEHLGIIPANTITISASELRRIEKEDGIEAVGVVNKAPQKAAPKATSFKVYRNGELIKETTSTEFKEILKNYGYFTYTIRSIFTNGWESADSKSINVSYAIPQKAQAPYNLQGIDEDGTLKLTWEAIDADSAVKKYHIDADADDPAPNMAFGMTGTGTREGYHAIKFKTEDLTPGSKISHVKFMLNEITNDNNQSLSSAAVFVMVGEDIMFEQNVKISDLVSGNAWNVVRLNRPFVIPEGHEVAVGYHITYPNGMKPCMTDKGPAESGYGDLISSSATSGYWYSLATKYNLNYNYRMEAVFQAPDQEITLSKVRKADASMTFNVQCDGETVAEGLTDMAYDVVNAEQGYYTVTAVVNGEESAESNGVQYGESLSGIENVTDAFNGIYYDAASKTVVLSSNGNANVYTVGGSLVERHIATDRINLSSLAKGVYIVTTDNGASLKVVR